MECGKSNGLSDPQKFNIHLRANKPWSNLLSQDEKDIQQESCVRSLVETGNFTCDTFETYPSKKPPFFAKEQMINVFCLVF
ncbi:hypothetical protein CEXT_544961 [Caerostris extrusa]|uniref:Uncharacterized protein n=1 Tax=Caerostris extrusa TaxID=172846 RepID=A0AAV4QA28_CAEEX|nr:hypothetical protein CEXT_544961 [Caerostris extrusa]